MDALIVFSILLLGFAPIIMAIIALVKVKSLRGELDAQKLLICQLMNTKVNLDKSKIELSEQVEVVRVKPAAESVQDTKDKSRPTEPLTKNKPKAGLEFRMAGRIAAFAGIGILVSGIALIVGYAIQNEWFGPEMRVTLGLAAGVMLVVLGHLMGRKDVKLTLLARVLTGGGSSLFYFAVFAAFDFYGFIGPVAAAAGFCASAFLVFGLALIYKSQSTGILGVVGAFITPLVIGGNMYTGMFPLIYISLINVPVILLGFRRKWQALYNLSFFFTAFEYLLWVDQFNNGELWIGLGFAVLLFLQYVALGFFKLKAEQQTYGRTTDMIRQILSSLFLLAAVYWLLNDTGNTKWIGLAFLIISLVHFVFTLFAFKLLNRFKVEILTFLTGGLIFLTLAIPAQLDGEWVSLGWALIGLVLAWFAARVQSRLVQIGALILGMMGLMKGLFFDPTLYEFTPSLFLNAHFIAGMISAACLAVQGIFSKGFSQAKSSRRWQDVFYWLAIVGAVVIFFADTFWTLGAEEEMSWLITSLMLVVSGGALLLLFAPKSSLNWLGYILLLLVPLKLLFLDAWIMYEISGQNLTTSVNLIFWSDLVMVVFMIFFLIPRSLAREKKLISSQVVFSQILNLSSITAGIGLVSMEILRKPSGWADMSLTIFWAVCALSLILFGMKRRNTAQRYYGLVLFVLATLKVLFFDSSELEGLARIGAFIGMGFLLLILSFVYQKTSAYFQSIREHETGVEVEH